MSAFDTEVSAGFNVVNLEHVREVGIWFQYQITHQIYSVYLDQNKTRQGIHGSARNISFFVTDGRCRPSVTRLCTCGAVGLGG